MRRILATSVAIAALVFSAGSAFANAHRPGQVPNGTGFSCGLCHEGGVGGAPRTPFGATVEGMFLDPPAPSNGDVLWGPALAAIDSDMDGFTNGEELCDPDGTWSTGDANPTCADGPTHPGDDTDFLPPTCGNGTREGDEPCDLTDFGASTCITEGFDGGDLACTPMCALNTGGCFDFVCGDDTADPGEDCDGTDISTTCEMEGFDGGTIACGGDCTVDTAGCFSCGDGVANGAEECDGTDLGGSDCIGEGFVGGTLACATDCTYDVAACTLCGNDMVDTGEQCDGTDLAESSCGDLGFDSGDLACDSMCQFDTTACVGAPEEVCGDDLRVGSEVCDGPQLGGETCISQGFVSGDLACASDCTAYDTSGCETCGDGAIDGDEECDGTDFGGDTCVSLGFDGGDLACGTDCTVDTSGCTTDEPPVCGDDIAEGAEVCDGTDLVAEDCTTQGFDGGDLACASDCTAFDTSACTTDEPPMCGDDAVNQDSEECDGSDLADETCESQGFTSGTLDCNDDCTFDTDDCSEDPGAMCGDGVAEGDEECDRMDLLGATCESQGFDSGTVACTVTCRLDTSGCEAAGMDVGSDVGADVGGGVDVGTEDGGDDDEGCCSIAAPNSGSGRGYLALGALVGLALVRRRR